MRLEWEGNSQPDPLKRVMSQDLYWVVRLSLSRFPHVNFGGLGGSGEPAMPTSSRAESVGMSQGQPRLKIRPEARER